MLALGLKQGMLKLNRTSLGFGNFLTLIGKIEHGVLLMFVYL